MRCWWKKPRRAEGRSAVGMAGFFRGWDHEMGVEASAGGGQEFGGGVQVGLGAGNGSVAEIGREGGQFGEQVGAAAVPGEETVHAKGMSGIVNAGAALSRRGA